MPFPFPNQLHNNLVIAVHLQPTDFDALYTAASDPKIWEQHPNKNRYLLPDFTNYFEGAITEGTAYLIKDASTNEVIGSTRYYGYDEAASCITIGYTFFITKCWGKSFNKSIKQLMLDYAFQFVNTVNFTVGAVNKRSQIAVERLGAQKVKELETAYYGEQPKLDFIYALSKEVWQSRAHKQQ
jgi:RimJ/RimL family protein N-acetyltransferase